MLRQKCGKKLFLNSSVKALLTPHGKHWQIVDLEMILLMSDNFIFLLCVFLLLEALVPNKIFWFPSAVWQSSHSGKGFKAKTHEWGNQELETVLFNIFYLQGLCIDSLLCN